LLKFKFELVESYRFRLIIGKHLEAKVQNLGIWSLEGKDPHYFS